MKRVNPFATRRMWKFISIPDGCWIWLGAMRGNGYGAFVDEQKVKLAHRVSYKYFVGDIPKGMFIDHKCKNRSCVNPGHLRLVTPRQNVLENSNSFSAKCHAKTHCLNGHAFDKKNTRINTDGSRDCRKCDSARSRAYYYRKKKHV